VQDLKFATLATVSRCGMVWFSEDTLTPEMIMRNYLNRLRNISLDQEGDTELTASGAPTSLAVSFHLSSSCAS
jgi:dynein heavy chain 1